MSNEFKPEIIVHNGEGLTLTVRPDEKVFSGSKDDVDYVFKFKDLDINNSNEVAWKNSEIGREEISWGVFMRKKYPEILDPIDGDVNWDCVLKYKTNIDDILSPNTTLYVIISSSPDFSDPYTEKISPMSDTLTLNSTEIVSKFGMGTIVYVRLDMTLPNKINIKSSTIRCGLKDTFNITQVNEPLSLDTNGIKYSIDVEDHLKPGITLTAEISLTEDFRDIYSEPASPTQTILMPNITEIVKKFNYNQTVYVRLKGILGGKTRYSNVVKHNTKNLESYINFPSHNTTNWLGVLKTTITENILTIKNIDVEVYDGYSPVGNALYTKRISNTSGTVDLTENVVFNTLKPNTNVTCRLKVTFTNGFVAYSSSKTYKTHTGFNSTPTLSDIPSNCVVNGRLWNLQTTINFNIRDAAKEYYRNNGQVQLWTEKQFYGITPIKTYLDLDIDYQSTNAIDLRECMMNSMQTSRKLYFTVRQYITITSPKYSVTSSTYSTLFDLMPSFSHVLPTNRSGWNGDVTVHIDYIPGLETYIRNIKMFTSYVRDPQYYEREEKEESLQGSSYGSKQRHDAILEYVVNGDNISYYPNFPVHFKIQLEIGHSYYDFYSSSYTYSVATPVLENMIGTSTLYASWDTRIKVGYKAEPLIKMAKIGGTLQFRVYMHDSSGSQVYYVYWGVSGFDTVSDKEVVYLSLGNLVRKIMELIGSNGVFNFKLEARIEYQGISKSMVKTDMLQVNYDFRPSSELLFEGTSEPYPGNASYIKVTSDTFGYYATGKDGKKINPYFGGDNGIIARVDGNYEIYWGFSVYRGTIWGTVGYKLISDTFASNWTGTGINPGDVFSPAVTFNILYMDKTNKLSQTTTPPKFFMTRK